MTLFLMSPPRRDWQLKGKANFRSQAADGVDAVRARNEWCKLADAICNAGGDVLVCPPHPEATLTGMIYTAEAGEHYLDDEGNQSFILPNMASPHRQAEAQWIGQFMRHLGIQTTTINGLWEAQGDAIRTHHQDTIIHTYGVGRYARTGERAYEQVANLLSDNHLQLRFEADPWFHGNTFLNIYEHNQRWLAVVCMDAVAEPEVLRNALGFAQIHCITSAQSMAYDTNALQVNQTVLASATLSEHTQHEMTSLGLRVEQIVLDELFVKGGGAPVCLTNRLWHWPKDRLPKAHLWSAQPNIEAHEAIGQSLWSQWQS